MSLREAYLLIAIATMTFIHALAMDIEPDKLDGIKPIQHALCILNFGLLWPFFWAFCAYRAALYSFRRQQG